MNERRGGLVNRTNYRLDGEGNALYWWQYREMYERVKPYLPEEGMRITQQMADKVGFAVGVLSVNRLEWNHFDFTKTDRIDCINGFPLGKSAHIDFTRSLGIEEKDIDMNMVVNAVTGRRMAMSNDHLYLAHISGIEYAEWQVRWCPLKNNPLHLLLVPNKLTEDSSVKLTKNDKERLTKVFWKVK